MTHESGLGLLHCDPEVSRNLLGIGHFHGSRITEVIQCIE